MHFGDHICCGCELCFFSFDFIDFIKPESGKMPPEQDFGVHPVIFRSVDAALH